MVTIDTKQLKLAIVGASGKMGQELIKAIKKDNSLFLQSEIRSSNIDSLKSYDVAIDFTNANATIANLDRYKSNGSPVVIGSTGFNDAQKEALLRLSEEIPIFYAANMSIGANAVATAAALLGKMLNEFDVDIIEAHHTAKIDAPSGTALMIGGKIKQAVTKDITYHSIRAGNVIGEHSVIFNGHSEQVTLTHKVQDRSIFALGALQVAKWMYGKEPGLYTFESFIKSLLEKKIGEICH